MERVIPNNRNRSSLFKSNKVHIVTLVSTDEHTNGKYVLSIDVVSSGGYDQLIRKRAEAGFAIHKCLMNTGKSPEIKLETSKTKIHFEVTGALRHDYHKDENVLEFTGSGETQKIVVLKGNIGDNTGEAYIVFTVLSPENKCLHKVCIGNVPIHKPAETTEQNLTVETKVKSDESTGPKTKVKSVETSEHTMTVQGRAPETLTKLEATPVPPRPYGQEEEPEPGEMSGGSDSAEDGAQAAVGIHQSPSTASLLDKSPCGRLISEPSLIVLAEALDPKDANKLFPILNVPDAHSKQIRANHPHDVVTQHFEILLKWLKNHYILGVDTMYQSLKHGLSQIGRNDIVTKMEIVRQQNRPLNQDDLRY